MPNPNTQTTLLNNVGVNDLSPEMKTYYEKRLIDQAEPKLVHDQFGDKYPIPAGGGKSIEFRKFDALPKAMQPLTEGVTPDGNTMNVTAITATVNQYGDYIQQSDLLELTAIDRTVVQATKMLAAQAGRTLDTVVREELVGGTNVIFAPDSSSNVITAREDLDATCKITPDLIVKAATILKQQNAEPIDDSFVAIIHPSVSYDLMRNEEFIEWQKYASPEKLYNGEIGKIGNVRFVETTEAKIWRGDNLAGSVRNLAVNNGDGYTAATTIAFDGDTGSVIETNSLKGRYVIINGTKTKITANTTTQMTVETAVTCADNAVIYPGEGGAAGIAVYATLVIGANAYATTEITGGGLEHIVKQKGYGEDPLNQRSAVGWKATKVAKRLVEQYMVRIESGSTYSATDKAN